MENEMYMLQGSQNIDSMELLARFIYSCKSITKEGESKSPLLTYADIVTAVYYYRRYPKVEDFLAAFFSDSKDYFMIQWVRSTWSSLSKMTEEEICNLVINQITLVANSLEEQ